MRYLSLLLLSLLPASCQLDRQDEVWLFAAQWLEIREVSRFESQGRCTAAVLRLGEGALHDSVYPVAGAAQAVLLLSYDQPVVLMVEGRTPHELSTTIMGVDLARGVGIINTVTGAEPCMTDVVAVGASELINTPDVVTVYDPVRQALIFADLKRQTAVYLRIKP